MSLSETWRQAAAASQPPQASQAPSAPHLPGVPSGTQPTAGFDTLLTGAAQLLLGLCLAWAAVLVLATAVEALSRGRLPALRWVGCPPVVRRALLAAVGVAVLAPGLPGQAASAAAPAGPTDPGRGARTSETTRVGPVRGVWLPVPARPTTAGAGHLAAPPARSGLLVVEPGDSLWALARDRQPDADDAALAAAVEELHGANRAVLGPDPDLIRPGQRLVLPGSWLHPTGSTTPSRGETP